MLASETPALDVVGARVVREIDPGEVVVIDDDGVHSIQFAAPQRRALCSFEFVYIARPDGKLAGIGVHAARRRMGARPGPAGTGRRRHGHADPRLVDPRRAGLRRRVRHRVRRRR